VKGVLLDEDLKSLLTLDYTYRTKLLQLKKKVTGLFKTLVCNIFNGQYFFNITLLDNFTTGKVIIYKVRTGKAVLSDKVRSGKVLSYEAGIGKVLSDKISFARFFLTMLELARFYKGKNWQGFTSQAKFSLTW
jgi:hypothetical protein